MESRRPGTIALRIAALLLSLSLPLVAGCVPKTGPWWTAFREQRHFEIRDPAQLPPVRVAELPAPPTVAAPVPETVPAQKFSLDDVLRIALANSNVIRVLAGVTAVSSGQTIYDVAISNTQIDAERSVFDPTIFARNPFSQFDRAFAAPDQNLPAGARLSGIRVDDYNLAAGLEKRNILGGQFSLDSFVNPTKSHPRDSVLNPQTRSSVSLGYTQPLLRGAGVSANLAPIVIARINTERSFFQFKDSVQDMVRGVIEAYWNVVLARTNVWVREQQVEQGEFSYERAQARKRGGFGNSAEVAQTKVALTNFKAALIGAQANQLQREAALLNILGLPPTSPPRFTLTTQPQTERIDPEWDQLLRLAIQRRPDVVELKLVLEADQQSLILARNQAQPQVDLTSLYRWNGLEGETPTGAYLRSGSGQYTEWVLGVNFSVPIFLRQARANERRVELLIARDRANLQQQVHFTVHSLAQSLRNLAQYHAQYEAYKETRAAARENLEQQTAEFRSGRAIFLNVLQAISNWGDAVSAEAQSLAQYNIELATLERETGTILETHGIRFVEERLQAVGPVGKLAEPRLYPADLRPTPNAPRYPASEETSEERLEREKPNLPRQTRPGEDRAPDFQPADVPSVRERLGLPPALPPPPEPRPPLDAPAAAADHS